MRRTSQLIIFLLYFLVPFLNLFRIDIPSGTYYWMTIRFPFSNAFPLLLTVLFLVFSVIGLSFYRPRLFCSHLCPHNTTSYWLRQLMRRKVDIPIAILLTPVTTFTLLCYFAAPQTVWSAITRGTSLILLFFFLVICVFIGGLVLRLRQRFCANICPYGFFQTLILPENPTKRSRIIVSVLLLLLAGGMVYTALSTSDTDVSLEPGVSLQTGKNMRTYTYTLHLTNNGHQTETFTVTFHGIQPAGNGFHDGIVVLSGQTKPVAFAFQITHTQAVNFDVCTLHEGKCRHFEFTLSGL